MGYSSQRIRMVGGAMMSNPLRKRYPRDLKNNFGRYIAVFLMLMATIALMSGFLSVSDGVQEAFIKNREDCKLEDGLFTSMQEIPQEIIRKIELTGTQVFENYYVNETVEAGKTLRVYKDREHINLVTVIEGNMPKGNKEIALERLFAQTNQIAIGDSVQISGKKLKVSGYVCLPDYSSLFEKNSDIMMDSFHFGVGIVTEEAFADYTGDSIVYNYSYRYKDQSLSNDQKREKSKDVREKLVENNVLLTNFCLAEDNNSISFVEDDLASDVPLMKVLMYMIIIIMAFVFSIVISSTIDSEATSIGTLLAFGYSKSEIIRHYIGLPIIVTICSAVVGNILGYTAMPNLFTGMYYGSYSLPPMKIRINSEALLLTTAVPILIMLVINTVILTHKLSISPLQFLRRELRKRTNRKPVKLPKSSFFSRFRLRVIFQNRVNYLTLGIGIFFASVILMFGLCISPLIEHYVDSIQKNTISNYQYILKYPVEYDTIKTSERFTLKSLDTYYKPAHKDIEVVFYGINEKSVYVPELELSAENEGVYFSDGLAKKLNKEVGDKVVFQDSYTKEKYTMELKGIHYYPAGLAVFMSQKELNKMLEYDKEYFNGYFSNDEIKFEDDNTLLTVVTTKDMVKLGDQMSSSFSQMAPLCLGISIIIYLVLMYLLTKIVIDKNAIHISFMKVFGYEENEIRKLYLTSTTLVVITSLLVTLPLVKITMYKCFELVLIKISGYIPIYVPTYLYLKIVLIGLISYFAINYLHVKRINRIEMSDALKNKE